VGFQTKWKIALELLGRARANGLSGPVLADSAYGDVTDFREALEAGHWAYSVGIERRIDLRKPKEGKGIGETGLSGEDGA